MPATSRGKLYALEQLLLRRHKNRKAEKIDNGSLPAGSPMFFYCLTCDSPIVVPEDYLTRPKLCIECTALKEAGWLE